MYLPCERKMTFVLSQVSDAHGKMSHEQRAVRLAVYELVLCWGLGAFQLREEMVTVRADYGLLQMPAVFGANATLCLDGPDGAVSPFGIVDERYKTVLQLARAAEADVIKAEYAVTVATWGTTAISAITQLTKAKRFHQRAVAAMRSTRAELFWAGEMRYR